jgi:hypothetical protein
MGILMINYWSLIFIQDTLILYQGDTGIDDLQMSQNVQEPTIFRFTDILDIFCDLMF